MNFFQKIRAVWQNVSVVQRALLVTVVLTFLSVGALLIHWARKPDMRMLYQELLPEEASKITEKIDEKGIPYELRSGGTSVYVPKEHVYQLRLDMAKEGLPVDSQGGYKIFDNEKIGISPFVQKVNLKRALQDELAKSIQMIDGVAHCRVHIVSAEQSIFASKEAATTASVVLQLRPGFRLNSLSIASIKHLVASSIDGLKPENITVVDSQGHLLSSESDQPIASGAATVQDYKERIEQTLAKKVETMLTAVLGPGRAVARVSAIVDMTSINLVTETYDPGKKVVSKEEIKTNSETEASNVAAEGEKVIPGGKKKDETIVTEYEVGKTIEQRVELPGQIKSLSVAAFVDLSPADANSEASEKAEPIMKISDVEEIITNAIGLRDTDSLKVVPVKFHNPVEALVSEESSEGLDYMVIVRHSSLGIMAICALLFFKVFSGAKKKASAGPETGEKLIGTEGTAGFLPPGAANPEPLALRRQISHSLRRNPQQVKQLFASWVQEEGD
jgi:flagellar M-ring protein FliF